MLPALRDMQAHVPTPWILTRFLIPAARADVQEHMNASWMVPPVGSFVAAFVCPMIHGAEYVEASYFWFGIALLMWLALFASTFQVGS